MHPSSALIPWRLPKMDSGQASTLGIGLQVKIRKNASVCEKYGGLSVLREPYGWRYLHVRALLFEEKSARLVRSPLTQREGFSPVC
jgi:hypothetical protein